MSIQAGLIDFFVGRVQRLLPGIAMNLPRNHFFSVGEPMILRCGWQLGVEYCDDDPPELLPDTVRMSFDRTGLVVRMSFEQSWFDQVAS